MNTRRSPVPRYMLRDTILGPRVESQEQAALELELADQDFAARYVELAETYNLHVEVGRSSHDGPPFWVCIMPSVIRERLAGSATAKLGWGAIIRSPGFAEGEMTRREAIDQARTNYNAAEGDIAPLPE